MTIAAKNPVLIIEFDPIAQEVFMSFFKALMLGVVLSQSFTTQAVEPIISEDYLFTHVNLISMTSDKVQLNKDVLIRNGKILIIEDAGKIKKGNANIIHASGQYLMPGLTEMHAHVLGEASDKHTRDHYLYLYLINGVTTIRGMLGDKSHLQLREDLKHNKIAGPFLLTSGPSLNGNSVTSMSAAQQKVKMQYDAGYDFLKLHPGLSKEHFTALADAAHQLGITFAGHISDEVGIDYALAKGQSSIDHMDGFFKPLIDDKHQAIKEQAASFFGINFTPYIDERKIDALAKKIANSNTWVVPTETLMDNLANEISAEDLAQRPEMHFISQKTINNWIKAKQSFQIQQDVKSKFLKIRAQLLTAIQKHGGKILLGSDAPQIFNVPGFSIHRELELMVKNGLTPYQALKAGTLNPAIYFGIEENFGTVEIGKQAELVLLSKNPLIDIRNSTSIQGVMHNGLWIDKQSIHHYLENYDKP